jgi:hypothetical protein
MFWGENRGKKKTLKFNVGSDLKVTLCAVSEGKLKLVMTPCSYVVSNGYAASSFWFEARRFRNRLSYKKLVARPKGKGQGMGRFRARGNGPHKRHSQFFVTGGKWNSEKGRPLSGPLCFEEELLNCENEGDEFIPF